MKKKAHVWTKVLFTPLFLVGKSLKQNKKSNKKKKDKLKVKIKAEKKLKHSKLKTVGFNN